MPWKKGRIEFDDGSVYPAEILVRENGMVWNTKIYKDGKVVNEFNPYDFANRLGKNVEDIYPYKYHID